MEKSNVPVIMEGYREKQFLNRAPQELERHRWEYVLMMVSSVARHTAKRIEASKQLFTALGGSSFFRGDCHSHTQHSDGRGTVAETAEMVKAAGLDFQFVTDHWGITQAAECREHGLWYGQEPVTEYHHMLILGLEQAFTPQRKFFEDMVAAKELGATVCIPHPGGWWPDMVYTLEQKQQLEKLPDPFLMEIVNGASNIINAIDYTDELAIEWWDHLLMLGRKVYGMGNTDAHAPHSIANVWNGVFAPECRQELILSALEAGNHFVSEAPLIEIENNAGRLTLRVAESIGLRQLKVVVDGKPTQNWHWHDDTLVRKFAVEFDIPDQAQKYVRVEVTANDGKRAFSNPIFLT